jgi:hypothetical protein
VAKRLGVPESSLRRWCGAKGAVPKKHLDKVQKLVTRSKATKELKAKQRRELKQRVSKKRSLASKKAWKTRRNAADRKQKLLEIATYRAQLFLHRGEGYLDSATPQGLDRLTQLLKQQSADSMTAFEEFMHFVESQAIDADGRALWFSPEM